MSSEFHYLAISGIIAKDNRRGGSYPAKNVLDKNIDSIFASEDRGGFHWIRLELLKTSKVHHIMIWNRKSYGNRLKNLEIRVGSDEIDQGKADNGLITENTHCGLFAGPGRNGEVITIKCTKPTDGKYVTLQMKDETSILNIAEVEVHGQGNN